MSWQKWVGRAPAQALDAEQAQRAKTERTWLQANWRGLSAVALVFALTRFAFYLVALAGWALFGEAQGNPVRVVFDAPILLALPWRWDAIHYGSIAIGGYTFYQTHPMAGNEPAALYAFFPLLPLLTNGLATILGGFQAPALRPLAESSSALLLSGVLVAHAATLLAFWLLWQLAREESGDPALADRTVLYAACFPLAFYYAVPYAEPIFLATSVGAFLAMRRRRWLQAGLWIAAASATRPFGILLLPVLAFEMLLAARRGDLKAREWPRVLGGLAFAPIGLVLFMLHLAQRVGDPLAFMRAQQAVWNREPMFPLTTIWLGLRYSLFPSFSGDSATYARTVIHTVVVVGFLIVMLLSLRQWRPSYILYGALLFVMVLTSPWPGVTVMHSLGRSVMLLFPVYFTFAHWGRRPAVHQTIIMLWMPLFGLLAALYACWYFVA